MFVRESPSLDGAISVITAVVVETTVIIATRVVATLVAVVMGIGTLGE